MLFILITSFGDHLTFPMQGKCLICLTLVLALYLHFAVRYYMLSRSVVSNSLQPHRL